MLLLRVAPAVLVAASVAGCLLVTHVDDDAFGNGTNVEPRADAASEAASEADAASSCPGVHGPKPVRVGAFCIDSTEVSIADYTAFLGDHVDPATQPAECSSNVDFTPGNWEFQRTRPTLPVAYVSWCDARAFCVWAGKRLCGKIGGGAVPNDAFTTTQSEWYSVCTHDGERRYPYGDTYSASACNGKDRAANDFAPVGLASCEGGYPGVFDMSGNVFEWIDSCDKTSAGPAGANDNCVVIGGSISAQGPNNMMCGYGFNQPRGVKKDADLGFRCCS